MPAPEPFTPYLGLPQDDRAVRALLQQFRITRTPSPARDDFGDPDEAEIADPQDWVSNLTLGIEFGFEDEAAFTGGPAYLWGLGPMLLTQIYLYIDHPEADPYRGSLPHGLTPDDDRESARDKLDPLARERRSRELDSWTFDGYTLTLGYLDDGRLSFAVLLCQPPPPEPAATGIRYPTSRQFAALLGVSVQDERLIAALAPLGFPHRLVRIDDASSIMDLREEFGAWLEFSESDSGMVLEQVELLGDRRYGAAVWPGDLPGGMRFGCGWAEVLAAAGSMPASESEDKFTLLADWPGKGIVTRVEYSTMTNQVLSVSLYLAAE